MVIVVIVEFCQYILCIDKDICIYSTLGYGTQTKFTLCSSFRKQSSKNTGRDACRNLGGRKTFPAFPAHAQPEIIRIWQEAHSKTTNYCRSKAIGDATIFIHRSVYVCWCYDLVLSHYRNDDLVDTRIDVNFNHINLWLRVTSSLRQWSNALRIVRIFVHVICSLIHQCKFMASSSSSIVNTQREQVVINVHIALSIWNIFAHTLFILK